MIRIPASTATAVSPFLFIDIFHANRYTQPANDDRHSRLAEIRAGDFSSDICWSIERWSIFVMAVLKKKNRKEGWKKRVTGEMKYVIGRGDIS